VHEASRSEIDPDRRIIAMLGARARGKAVAKASMTDEQNLAASAG
jgi:hypothetical protein